MSKRTIQGSRAIVTGASGGIGRAVALELARQGAAVVVVARRQEQLDELVEQIVAEGGRAVAVAGDVTEAETRQRAVEAATSQFGGLDVLVNNAGVGATGPFRQADPQRLRQIMEVNFFATAEMTRVALPQLERGNRPIVVNVASVLAYHGAPYNSEYSASKFAVRGFSESIRAELAATGIDVLVVSPGTTETEFFDNVLEDAAQPSWPEHKPVTAAAVARQTVRAIRLGKHEIVPYGWGRVFCWLNRLSPRFVDRLMARYS